MSIWFDGYDWEERRKEYIKSVMQPGYEADYYPPSDPKDDHERSVIRKEKLITSLRRDAKKVFFDVTGFYTPKERKALLDKFSEYVNELYDQKKFNHATWEKMWVILNRELEVEDPLFDDCLHRDDLIKELDNICNGN